MFGFGKKKAPAAPVTPTVAEDEGRDPNYGELELTHVGKYEILKPIGSGGMGTVYKALDRERDQLVAIKVLDRRYDLDKKRRKSDYLGREILIAASLDHKSIVRMHKQVVLQEDVGGNVRRCLIMEFVDGHNLRKHINDRDLTMPQMIKLCINLGEGLDFLHQHDIVHRDVKPENFLFTRDMKQVKIVDFGLSKSRATWRTRWIKEAGGTRRYMSPEQLQKKKLDARSDIFSFGITMFELFTGQHPCSASDTRDVQKQILSSSYRFPIPSRLNPEIPRELDRIILKAMRRKMTDRYQSMTEMLMDLSRIAESRI
ncbi:MAG TPA: serine/threonine-protein kinase [Candidatus Hydrogenedentes bacterium]|nr:serine/threonine-protein kinase [Candidatus Hydrogenedentota bacterium]HPG65336.1 serine/threonine-protein kinase [Candidatus Hydrogenedentota bacterium]